MKKKLIAFLIFISCFSTDILASSKVNLSPKASTVKASVNSATAGRINDGSTSALSFWSGYQGTEYYGAEEYVELQWTDTVNVVKTIVTWAVSGDTIALPTAARLTYYSDGQWIDGPSLTFLSSGGTSQEMNITGSRIRLYMSGEKACGICEVRLLGYYDETAPYTWPSYSPTLFYDYRQEYPSLEAPTQFLPEDNNQKGYMTDGWWAVAWGPTPSHYVTDTAKTNLLAKMNEDFAYFRDEMGWPPDKRARNGYYSTVYVYGSGLYSDGGADSTSTGGWQSATWWNGSSWPMVDISYYPIACFDPAFTYDAYQSRSVTDQTYQQNACVHEGIHAIFADLDGCKNSAWYHEAGNTWLQAEAEVKKSGSTPESMGWLSAGNMIAPFMPIECYSGWLLDGSFGGPSAEGVNSYKNGQQICTWRNLLGGVQYGELFPHFVSEILGDGSIPWIWRYCRNRVLEGMADSLGETQMRRLILEYRSRQAMIDVGTWSKACRKLLDDNWLLSIKQEWSPYSQEVEVWNATPYVNMYQCDDADSTGWWYPEARTTPGWSGANQIPLHVDAAAGNVVTVHFKPLGENMVCQLTYRSTRGRAYYSNPCYSEGDVSLKMPEDAANGVVIAVVCNTDYIYIGDKQRKTHYDYRLKMGENVYQPAKAQLKWYNYNNKITDSSFETAIEELSVQDESVRFSITAEKQRVHAGESVRLHITAASRLQIPVRMYSSSGQMVYSQSLLHDGEYNIPPSVAKGLYILQAVNGGQRASTKIIIQ